MGLAATSGTLGRRVLAGVPVLTALIVGFSLFGVAATEGSHAHAGSAETSAVCPVCQPAPAAGPAAPTVTTPALRRAPGFGEEADIPAVLLLAPHQSRAPPVSISY